jgi:hypothetical protein
MVVNRRKSFKYKSTPKKRVSKTSRTEIPAETRAFIAGAVLFGNASQHSLAATLHRGQSSISEMLKRVKDKADEGGFDLWDPVLYQNDIGRGRPEVLTQGQREEIIRITTQNRTYREKQAWQAIQEGIYDAIASKISVTTIENVMYQAGFSRRRPGWKPSLTPSQQKERYAWALRYNPDKYELGDRLGFDFRTVVFTDETPARVGEQRGMLRTWARDGEIYADDVRHTRTKKDCCL